jgi:uncharacterized protein
MGVNPRGVTKPLLVVLVVAAALLAITVAPAWTQTAAQTGGVTQLPRPTGFVSDFAGIVAPDAARQIEAIAGAVKDRTGAEIAVVTINSYGELGYAAISEFGIALADHWGVGDAEQDMGVILILAMQERQIRLEVGYGLEGALPDGRAGAIIDQAMVPAFQAGRYGEGFLAATRLIAGVIGEETGVDLSDAGAAPAVPQQGTRRTTSSQPVTDMGQLIVFLIIFMLFGGGRFLFWPLLFGRFRRGFYGGGFGSPYRGYRTGGRGGFGGGGFGGGGFGGFGGGGFGGGGASRGF